MMIKSRQPQPDDAVLGGQSLAPIDGAVLGGIEGVKQRFEVGDIEQKKQALDQALQYGDRGLDFLSMIERGKFDKKIIGYVKRLRVLKILKQSRPLNLAKIDLRGIDLSGVNLTAANLSGVDLSGANLCGGVLRKTSLFGANLLLTDLSRADLQDSNLTLANLYGANLSETNLSGANLFGANLKEANLGLAKVNSTTYIDKQWQNAWWWYSLKHDKENDKSTPLCKFINW